MNRSEATQFIHDARGAMGSISWVAGFIGVSTDVIRKIVQGKPISEFYWECIQHRLQVYQGQLSKIIRDAKRHGRWTIEDDERA